MANTTSSTAPGTTPREKVYMLPNSEPESSRLDFQHTLLVRMFGGLSLAPLNPSKLNRVLDVGCGTGNWASDFATFHPSVDVLGIDIEDKPGMRQGPSNFRFKYGDFAAERTWMELGKGEFDYIHLRFVSVAVKDWGRLLERCLAALRPGGWIELQELDYPLLSADAEDVGRSKLLKWSDYFVEGSEKAGLGLLTSKNLPEFLASVGYTQVHRKDFKMYSSAWPEDEEEKEIGKMGQKNLSSGMPGFSEVMFTRVLGWSKERLEEFLGEVVEELLAGTYRTYLPVTVNWAQRPLTG